MPAAWREIKDEREKYQHYLCSREWNVLKEAVHKRAEGVCERCGQYQIDAVHHLTYAAQIRRETRRLDWLVQALPRVHPREGTLGPARGSNASSIDR